MTEVLDWEIKQCLLCSGHWVLIVIPEYMFRGYYRKYIKKRIIEIRADLFPDNPPVVAETSHNSSFSFGNGSYLKIGKISDKNHRDRYHMILVHDAIPDEAALSLYHDLYNIGTLVRFNFDTAEDNHGVQEDHEYDITECTDESICAFLGISTQRIKGEQND